MRLLSRKLLAFAQSRLPHAGSVLANTSTLTHTYLPTQLEYHRGVPGGVSCCNSAVRTPDGGVHMEMCSTGSTRSSGMLLIRENQGVDSSCVGLAQANTHTGAPGRARPAVCVHICLLVCRGDMVCCPLTIKMPSPCSALNDVNKPKYCSGVHCSCIHHTPHG